MSIWEKIRGKEKFKKSPDMMLGGMESKSERILFNLEHKDRRHYFVRESKHLVGDDQEDRMADYPARC